MNPAFRHPTRPGIEGLDRALPEVGCDDLDESVSLVDQVANGVLIQRLQERALRSVQDALEFTPGYEHASVGFGIEALDEIQRLEGACDVAERDVERAGRQPNAAPTSTDCLNPSRPRQILDHLGHVVRRDPQTGGSIGDGDRPFGLDGEKGEKAKTEIAPETQAHRP